MITNLKYQKPKYRKPKYRKGALAAGLATSLLLAACGDSNPLTSGTEDLTEAEKSRVAEDYRDCMAEGGLDAQVSYEDGGIDVSVGGGDFSAEEARAVEAECEPILAPLDPEFDMTPEQEARIADASLATQKCLDEAGYVVTVNPNGGIDFNSDDQPEGWDMEEYMQVEEECFRSADPELFGEMTEELGEDSD